MSYKYRQMISKGDLMRKVFTEEENGKIDSATPMSTWDEFPPIDHVMSYCEPHTYGKLLNIEEEAKKRGIKLYHAPKIWFKEFNNLDEIFRILDEHTSELEDPFEIQDCLAHLKEIIEYEDLRTIK